LHFFSVENAVAYIKENSYISNHSAGIPVLINFIIDRMIISALQAIDRGSIAIRFINKFRSRIGKDSRYALLGHREVIRSIKESFFGIGIRLNLHIMLSRNLLKQVAHAISSISDEHNIPGFAIYIHSVKVDIGRHFTQWYGGMRSPVFRSQQALFFRTHK